jgi:acetyl esterase/lipase
MKSRNISIIASGQKLKMIILEPEERKEKMPGILWIHGGGYAMGMASMVYFSRGKDLGERFGCVVISPEYRLSGKAPYPAALDDCYAALEYMWDHADELKIDRERIIVGGESAGGGLAAAVCLYARDRGKVKIAMQLPLYPMLDCEDTETSRDNHGKIWNTKRNHRGWRRYLGRLYGTRSVPPYASPSRAEDLSCLPPCYTYVGDGEPFLAETLDYVARLRKAGVEADADVFHTDVHAFDRMTFWTKEAKEASEKICRVYADKIAK